MKFEKHCWAEIDLDALRHNFAYIRQAVGGPVCAVVKADAYGHGDVATAKTIQQAGVAGFAVSSLGEGHHLRHNGITIPILILGYADPAHAATLAEDDIATACFSTEYAQALSAAAVQAGVRVKVHIKIDTGMGRIGFAVRSGFEETIREVEALYALPGLAICGIFQHFAVADSDAPDDLAYTEEQYDLFTRVVDRLQADGYATGTVHCANSAAQLRHPEWRRDMTRAGIILYGLDPSEDAHFPELQPALSLHCIVTFVKELQPGQCVSYGRTFTADHPMRVATVCVGYADGYPRSLSNKGYVLINGKKANIVGNICMDQLMVDCTDIEDVKRGDIVTMIGTDGDESIRVEDLSAISGRFNYEFVCGITKRIPRNYYENGNYISTHEHFHEKW